MMKSGVLMLATVIVTLSLLGQGDSVSPPEGSVIMDFEGPVNMSFNCDQFSAANATIQVTTAWTYRLASAPEALIQISVATLPNVFKLGGTDRVGGTVPFPTYHNMLTILNLMEEFDQAKLSCGQAGSLLEQVSWTIRIYRPPSLRDNFSVKIAIGDVNIPVNLGMSPAAFPAPDFQWSKDGTNVDSSADVNYTYPTALFQNPIGRSASGNYSLTAVNYQLNSSQLEVGRDTGNFILDVLFGPDIAQGSLQHYVLVGEPISLVCGTSLVSNPAATISWSDIQGQEIQNTGRYTFDNGPETVQLNFSFTTAADSGVWGCSIVVNDSDVMTASGGMLIRRNNVEIGSVMKSIMLTVVVPPSEPRNVGLDAISDSQATLSWREPEVVGQPLLVSYEITADDIVNAPIVYNTGSNRTDAQTISGLPPGVSYQFTVRAITEGGGITGRGNASTPVNGTTSVSAPFPVCESVTSMNGIINVSWSLKHTGGVALTALKVFYSYIERLNIVNGSEISVGISNTTVAVPGLEAGRQYTFSVIAVNSEGSTTAECMPVLHREGIPTAPKPPVVVLIDSSRVRITLVTTSPGVLSSGQFYYDVKYETVAVTAEQNNVTYSVAGGGEIVRDIEELSQGIYVFSARSRNNFGVSEYVSSAPINVENATIGVTTLGTTPPSPGDSGALGGTVGGVVGGLAFVIILILVVVLIALLILRFKEGGSYQVSKHRNRIDSSAGVKIEEVSVDIGDDIGVREDKEIQYAELETFRPPSAQKPATPVQPDSQVEYATITSFKKADSDVTVPLDEGAIQAAATNV